MPQSPADRLINRITALHRSLQLDDGGKLSTMERDLMLGYLRELYEIYASHQEGKPYAPPPVAPVPAPAKPVEVPTPPKPAPVPAPPVVNTPPPPPVAPPPVTPPPVAPIPVAPPPVAPPPAAAAAPTLSASSPAVRALFVDDAPASRFGRQPLSDLAKGLTINTRILFTRDLFGGDGDLLNTSVNTLNSIGSFAAAQSVMENLARRFEWQEEGKVETAREFIELVRRRYV